MAKKNRLTPLLIVLFTLLAVLILLLILNWYIESTSTPRTTHNSVPQITDQAIVKEKNEWKIYENLDFKFSINYPPEWIYEVFEDTIFFGTPESKTGGYIFGVFIDDPDDLENQIAKMGQQFNDRKEVRENIKLSDGTEALLVTVTTEKYPDWVYKRVFFEKDGLLYSLGNGAVEDENFEKFYNSFKFINN